MVDSDRTYKWLSLLLHLQGEQFSWPTTTAALRGNVSDEYYACLDTSLILIGNSPVPFSPPRESGDGIEGLGSVRHL